MNPNNAEINSITKESIAKASAELLLQSKEMTVTAICRKAGVSRNAFYRNFESINDALIDYMIFEWAEYAKEHRVSEGPQEEVGKHLARYFYAQKEFVRALKGHHLIYLIEQLFVKVVVQEDASGALYYARYGTAYFIYGLIRAMIDNDFRDSPEEIEAMFRQEDAKPVA